jgi:hypothetical protein
MADLKVDSDLVASTMAAVSQPSATLGTTAAAISRPPCLSVTGSRRVDAALQQAQEIWDRQARYLAESADALAEYGNAFNAKVEEMDAALASQADSGIGAPRWPKGAAR